MPLRLRALLRSFRAQTTITSVRLQFACFDAVVQEPRQHFLDNEIAQRRCFDWERHFYPAQEVSRHPISARKITLRLAAIFEIINATVLEKTTDDADHANVFAQTGNFRAQTTNAAHDQIDCDLDG